MERRGQLRLVWTGEPRGTRRAGPVVAGNGRCQERSSPLRDDTQRGLDPTPAWEARMLKKVRDKATEIVLTSVDLYRDMALSALRLVGRRD